MILIWEKDKVSVSVPINHGDIKDIKHHGMEPDEIAITKKESCDILNNKLREFLFSLLDMVKPDGKVTLIKE